MSEVIVAFSGGKDSTAMALLLYAQGQQFRLLHTPTGNELPDVRTHILDVARRTGAELIDLEAPTLGQLIEEWGALPNWRQRWCTRVIKIEPCLEWLRSHPTVRLAVGLRADEPGRAGLYGAECEVMYPLREWGLGEREVLDVCEVYGVRVPARTDCAVCYYQTLHEWWLLWRYHPEEYAQGEQWEEATGHTFRSPSRDSRPAALRDLRDEFERGYAPKPRRGRQRMCRVCSL